MRIGIDGHLLGKGKGGAERVVHQMVQLTPSLMPEHSFFIFVKSDFINDFPESSNVTFIKLPFSFFSNPFIQRSFILPWLTRKYQLDLIHVQRLAPLFTQCHIVVTIHDILPLLEPGDYPEFSSRIVRLMTGTTIKKSSQVITVSKTACQEIIDRFPHANEKTTAIYNGVEHDLFHSFDPQDKLASSSEKAVLEKFSISFPYLLYVGAFHTRKNLKLVINAFSHFIKTQNDSVQLVLAGMARAPEYANELQELCLQLGLENQVIFTGFVTDNECASLMRQSTLFLAPSRGEGFDLPPLEAMACGSPVICSDIPVHRELLDGTAVFFDPNQAKGLAEKIQSLWSNPEKRKMLSESGLKKAQSLSWQQMAQELSKLYQSLSL